MRVKNTWKNSTQESDFQKAAIAIYRGLVIRLKSEKKKT